MKKMPWLLLAVTPVVPIVCDGSDDDKQTAQIDYLAPPGDAKLGTRSVDYKCENGRKFTVQYPNKGGNSPAVAPIGGSSTLIFGDVISAPDVKYATGQYIWWIEDEGAILYGDRRDGELTGGVAYKEH